MNIGPLTTSSWFSRKLCIAVFLIASWQAGIAQESPYFVTDHHHLPDAGALGLAYYGVGGDPKVGDAFVGSTLELEYRPEKWWATEVLLEGQTTFNQSTIFTAYAWINMFKLVPKNRWINSVLTIGWEDSNAANKSIVEIEGHSGENDFNIRNDVYRRIREHEIETKVILSRDHKGWNFAGNVIGVKDLSGEPWQFGYAFGVSRPLSTKDAGNACLFCRKSFAAGLEFYGGLGDAHSLGLQNTSHYLGPEISWQLSERLAVKAGPHFGLTSQSQHALIHFGVVYDIPEFGKRIRELFH
jgi:hypothetical protein